MFLGIGPCRFTGGLTAKPAVLRGISGACLALKTFSETKDYKHKIEMSKFAYTTCQKVLLDLKPALRGGSFNKNDFLKELNLLDDTITNFFPLVTNLKNNMGNNSSLSPLLTLINIIFDEIIDLCPPLAVTF